MSPYRLKILAPHTSADFLFYFFFEVCITLIFYRMSPKYNTEYNRNIVRTDHLYKTANLNCVHLK